MFQSLKRRDLWQQYSSMIAYRLVGWREDIDAVCGRGIDAGAFCAKDGNQAVILARTE